jgi:cytochrome c553
LAQSTGGLTIAAVAALLVAGTASASDSASGGLADGSVTPSGDGALALEAEHAVTRILSLEGDAVFGEYLGGECVTCHRQTGGSSGIPPIRGLPADYIVQALVDFRLGIRKNEVMKLMTARLAEEEIASLAAYFAEEASD